jgi:hypothetical protein
MVVQFWNLSSEPVHLVQISLAAHNAAVRLVGTAVYNAARTGGFPAEKIGDLPKQCPRQYVPSPVTSLTVAPRKYSHWFAAVAIKIMKPGRYLIRQVRIDPPLPGPIKMPPAWGYG